MQRKTTELLESLYIAAGKAEQAWEALVSCTNETFETKKSSGKRTKIPLIILEGSIETTLDNY